ncbi:MAG: formate dehydrogenase accessory sulfurtransferase FdhD [Firmicutes bacterium]|nr:formate dehydrogenase accessory sulfurtransferase FdhD [Bacillota bacterium]
MTDLSLGVKPITRFHWKGGQWQQESSEVVEEMPITLFVNGDEYVTVALTPIDLRDWAVGFLAGEGLIASPADMTIFLWQPHDGQLWVRIPGAKVVKDRGGRYLGSCCGQSRPGFFNPADTPPLTQTLAVDMARVQGAYAELTEWSHTQHSGGLHVAGLVYDGRLLFARADVGRHNALDKLFGAALAESDVSLSECVVLFSGRLSAEIVWKVRLMGATTIVSNAAPTSLGISLADRLGITAIGFLREHDFSVFSHPGRLALPGHEPTNGL